MDVSAWRFGIVRMGSYGVAGECAGLKIDVVGGGVSPVAVVVIAADRDDGRLVLCEPLYRHHL